MGGLVIPVRMFILNAAIDNCDADARSIVAVGPCRAGVHGRIGVVVHSLKCVIYAHVFSFWIVGQMRERIGRDGVGRRVDQVQALRQASSVALQPRLCGRQRSMFVLDDDAKSVACCMPSCPACDFRIQVACGDLCKFAGMLAERHTGEQQEHDAHALPPRGAVTLVATFRLRELLALLLCTVRAETSECK